MGAVYYQSSVARRWLFARTYPGRRGNNSCRDSRLGCPAQTKSGRATRKALRDRVGERPTTNNPRRFSHSKLQNSVDTSFIVPQYLVSERPLVLFIGLVFQATGPGVQSGKGNRSMEDPSMATKKKAKKKKH
jgi:hypothetical protein